MQPKQRFIFWQQSGRRSFSPQSALFSVLAVISVIALPLVEASSEDGNSVGTTRRFARASSSGCLRLDSSWLLQPFCRHLRGTFLTLELRDRGCYSVLAELSLLAARTLSLSSSHVCPV